MSRVGVPISVKLILVTSIVIAGALGASTWFSYKTVEDLTATQIKNRSEAGNKAIQVQAELITRQVARAIELPMSQSQYPDVQPSLDVSMKDDVDHLVEWMEVTEQTGKVVAKAGRPPASLTEIEAKLGTEAPVGGISRVQLDGPNWVYGSSLKSGNAPVGAVRIGVTTKALDDELATEVENARGLARASRDRLLLVSAAVLLIGIVLAALQGVALSRPIKALTVQANKIAGGDLMSRVPDKRGDELGQLARTFNFMTDEIVALLEEQSQKASLEKEMELAREVQQAMLPPDVLDEHGSLKVVGYCMPASSCGGDWWTYRKLASGRMLLVVGDATGHGIHSAMIAATARGAVEALAGVDERLLTPEQVLRAIDMAIRQVGDHNVLMTAFAGVFDSQSGTLHYANAGQNFPYVLKLDADSRVLGDASIIAASGNPLGDRNIVVEIRRGSLQLGAGDLFVCFTDGVVERTNPQGKLFGDRRLRQALTGKSLLDAQELVKLRDGLVQTLERYAEGSVAEDDVTFVLCQFDPPALRRSAPNITRKGAA